MKILFSLSICFLFIGQFNAQTFPKERDKFVKEWQKLVLDEGAVTFLKEDFPQKIKGSLMNETQFQMRNLNYQIVPITVLELNFIDPYHYTLLLEKQGVNLKNLIGDVIYLFHIVDLSYKDTLHQQ